MIVQTRALWRRITIPVVSLACLVSLLVSLGIHPSHAASGGTVQFMDLPYSPNTIPLYKAAAIDFNKKTGTTVAISQDTWDNAHAKFLSLLAAHKQPDVAVFGPKWLPEFIKLGVLQPLEGYFPKSFLSNFPKSLLKQVTFNGHLWALPEALSTRLMYYRTDLFRKAHIKQPPKTWAQFLSDAKKLNSPPNHYGFVEQGNGDETIWYYTYFLYGAGGRYTNKSGQWAVNQPANVRALKFEADLANKYKVTQPHPTGSGLDTAQELLVKGKSAMHWGPPWIISIIKQQNPSLLKHIQVADYPTVSGRPAPLFIQDVFVMFKGAQDPQAAAKFLQFWSKDKYQIKFNTVESLIPVTTSAGKAKVFRNDKRIQRFVHSIPYAISYPVKDGWDVVNTEVDKAIQSALLGTSAKKALDQAQAAITRQLGH